MHLSILYSSVNLSMLHQTLYASVHDKYHIQGDGSSVHRLLNLSLLFCILKLTMTHLCILFVMIYMFFPLVCNKICVQNPQNGSLFSYTWAFMYNQYAKLTLKVLNF